MIPERNEKGKYAKSVFFHAVNDIDIYVEDTAKGTEKLYKNLFQRVFSKKIRIYNVFPIGGKSAVIERCKADSGSSGRISLYVIDGDLGLLNDEIHKLDRLLTLQRYSIENYLIDSSAIIDLLFEEDIAKERDELKKELDYDGWITANENLLCELFAVYSIAHRIIPDIQTVRYKVRNMVASGRGDVCETKVRARIDKIESTLSKEMGKDTYESEKQRVMGIINDCAHDKLITYVSGKDYLLPLLLMRMKSIVKIGSSHEVIKQRLSMKCEIDPLKKLKTLVEIARCLE